ncbi:hypothetical protein Tco_0822794 [Tanacetum coccineum]|uniref:Retrovirus-related Pol polyprotein from transposon TNT 1-94-like beta-barrel domain-containing protein n=1 Tax=Tanacetum coccineum TaxID=301880 RepID=A0ABQ5AG29_9ASTR
MQQSMPNPKDISDPTTTMNMALILMAKAFKLNYSTSTNNQRTSSNSRNREIAQPGKNMGQERQIQLVGDNGGNQIANQNANQTGNGNVVAAQARGNGNGNNGDIDEIEKVNANCVLMANLHKASTSGTQTDKASMYDSDVSAEVHHNENCYNNDIFNMFTQKEQYTELLDPILEPHMVQQNNSNVISMESSVEHSGGIVEQHPAIVEVTRAYFESLYNNLAIEVEKVNTVNRKMKETNADLTTELARYKGQEKSFEINKAKFDELETGVDNTAKTRRPQPRSNTKNDKKHMSSECNNIKLVIRNDKSEVVCVLNYVNDMNSRDKNQNANVSNVAHQKKHKPKVKKTKKVGSKERLASPKPRKPRTCLRWLPTGIFFDLKGKLIVSSESECKSDSSTGHTICLWCVDSGYSKHMTGNSKILINLVWKFLGTVRFGNDHIAVILGYGDLQWGNILITRVYFVEGLGHNLFSVGQFCDSDLEVAFKRNTCFIRNLEGVNLLKGIRTTNFYTINLYEMASAS